LFLLDESSFDKYYAASLDYVEQFIEGKIDQNKFEDIVREMFGVDSYGVFTFDKLIHSIAKQVITNHLGDVVGMPTLKIDSQNAGPVIHPRRQV